MNAADSKAEPVVRLRRKVRRAIVIERGPNGGWRWHLRNGDNSCGGIYGPEDSYATILAEAQRLKGATGLPVMYERLAGDQRRPGNPSGGDAA